MQNYFGDAEVILDSNTDVRSDDEDDEFFSEVEGPNLRHELTYTIKLINPACKKEFHSIELGKAKVCKSLRSLRDFISKKLQSSNF